MPIYEYLCPDGHITERFGAMNDAPTGVLCDAVLFGTGAGLTDAMQTHRCLKPAERILSAPALKRDGAYSHRAGERLV